MHHRWKQHPCRERRAASRLTGCGGTLVLTGPGCSVRPGRENVAAIKGTIVLNTPASVPGPPQRTWVWNNHSPANAEQPAQCSPCSGARGALRPAKSAPKRGDEGCWRREAKDHPAGAGGGLPGPGRLRTRPQTVALGPRSAHSPQRAGLPPPGFGLFEENQPNCNK